MRDSDEPHLETAADAAGEDRVAAWFTDADVEEVTTFTARATGAAVRSLAVPGRTALAVPGGVRIADRFATASGWQYLTLAWPAGPRGAAAGSGGGVVRHGVPYAAPGSERRCRVRGCGGVVLVDWCPEHGTAAAPALEWHPAGGIRCEALAGRRAGAPSAHTR
ncbi:hypothetical protein [Streptomyces sp. NPDC089919]|uniref:hypothetical protein n=1 Tax=Streptomyces sp. NPDC089919 TaxID=3155188 RepID=UPI003414A6DD